MQWLYILLVLHFVKGKIVINFNSEIRSIVNGDYSFAPLSSKSSNYMVSIHGSSGGKVSWCGGSLISDRVVLTAAHCTMNTLGERYRALNVLVNHLGLYERGDAVEVDSIVTHPNYEVGTQREDDIALLFLKDAVPLCSYPNYTETVDLIMTAADSSTTSLFKATDCSLKGWGITEEGDMSPQLRTLKLDDRRLLEYDTFYFETPGQSKACHGDSGGPVVCELPDGSLYQIGVAVGIYSDNSDAGTLDSCHDSKYVVVTDLRRHEEFIRNVLQDHGQNRTYVSMTVVVLVFALLASAVVSGHSDTHLPRRSVPSDPNHRMILFGFRHGNRNPEKFLEENPRKWGHEGDTELTLFGKRQGFGLGKEMRNFAKTLVRVNFIPKEAKFYSSSANRCQMTLQSALAGFYPPQSFATWNAALDWTPVPYTIDDPLLRMYAVENCPTSDKAWAPISDDNLPDLRQLIDDKKPILDYIANHTGWNASISNAADLADNILEIDLYNASYPEWLEHPTLPGYTKETLKKEILSFGESHQIKCAEYEPCRDMMAGYWLRNIIDYLEKFVDNRNRTYKLIGYASVRVRGARTKGILLRDHIDNRICSVTRFVYVSPVPVICLPCKPRMSDCQRN
uniref:Peptidase S1 domain-containing protein n=1 Tax=Steinernema glaseri TaxID=37863 RepID=A0A1I7Y3B6_9BILA